MAKILSQEEIDALLNASSSGDIDPELGIAKKRVTLYDFKHPSLISKEQMRLLENIHDGLARNFSVFLSAQLRMIVDMNLLAIDQIMYSEFVMSIAPPGALYMGNFDDPYSQFVLEISPQLIIFIVERLFGGRGDFVSSTRPISVIEEKIMGRVVQRVSDEIEKNWEPIKKFTCSFTRFESNPEFVQIVPASEPVIVVSLEIKIHGKTTMMNICYPYMWISNIISKPEVQEKMLFGTKGATIEEQDLIVKNLELTNVHLQAVLGRNTITISDFYNLRVGDVIRLDSKIDGWIPIFSKSRHLYDASIGKIARNYAFKINSIIEEGQNNGI